MTGRSTFPALVAACLGMLAVQVPLAQSADLPPEVYAPEIAATSVGSGWYVRGDLGYTGWMKAAKPSVRNGLVGGGYDDVGFESGTYRKPMSYGAGFGYQFNDFLRADVTGDLFNSRFSGTSELSSGRCSTSELAGTSCSGKYRAALRGGSILANGYVDLGTYGGFTPYVGAGAGFTHITWKNGRIQPFCVSGSAACSGAVYNTLSVPGEESWRFTYALMAGVSYDLMDRVKLDLGYRYSDIAGGNMLKFTADEAATGASGSKAQDNGFRRHEIRAGLRITTW